MICEILITTNGNQHVLEQRGWGAAVAYMRGYSDALIAQGYQLKENKNARVMLTCATGYITVEVTVPTYADQST